KSAQPEKKKLRHGGGGAFSMDKDSAGGKDRGSRLIKNLRGKILRRFFKKEHLRLTVAGSLKCFIIKKGLRQRSHSSLGAGLLHNGSLQAFEILTAHMTSKAGDGGLRDAKAFRHLADGHKEKFLPVFFNKIQDILFRGGKP